MKAAKPLDGDDMPVHQHAACGIHVVHHRKGFVINSTGAKALDPCAWSANMARDRLGMEAPVCRIGILLSAFRAHRETSHGRAGTIIGAGLDNRETRPAFGTIGKGVAIATLERIAHFFKAGGADCRIGRYSPAHAVTFRCTDNEALGPHSINCHAFYRINPRQCRQRRAQFAFKARHRFAPKANFNPAAGVAHITG